MEFCRPDGPFHGGFDDFAETFLMADLLRSETLHLVPATPAQRLSAHSDRYFRKIVDGLPAAIYTTDALGRITYFNEAAAALWGHRPELGKSEWCGSWKLFWPDGTALPHGECPMAMAINQKRPNRGMEAIAERPDGTRVPFIPYPTPLFDDDGVLIGAVNMLVDISDRKLGEAAAQRLAAIVESSDDAILTKDLNGIITTWNKGAERIFGYTAGEIIGKPVLVLIPEEHHAEEPVIMAKIRKGERIDHYETIRRRKDGSLFDISLTISPVRGLAGHITGASKVARDISEHKRSLRQRELLLREMNHRVKNLFALASGVVALSARSATTPKELAQTVGERLRALARAHDLTMAAPGQDSMGQSAMLHALIGTIVTPYDGKKDEGGSRVSIAGADIRIAGEAVTSIALLLHEFTTNAAKYGALSTPAGSIKIAIAETADKVLLTWKEFGGPSIDHKNNSEGFGSVLARMTVTGQLGGEIARDWQPDGLYIQLSVDRARLAGRAG
jgi:PAS domain S-box-containing protein